MAIKAMEEFENNHLYVSRVNGVNSSQLAFCTYYPSKYQWANHFPSGIIWQVRLYVCTYLPSHLLSDDLEQIKD